MAHKCMAIALIATSAQAWNECAFPDVDYYAVDEGIGISFAYGAAGMNGKLYNGGYMKGHMGYVGVTDTSVVEPEPSATLWGDAKSNIQHLYVAEIDATGKMAKSWFFKSSNIQVGSPGHGANGDRVQVNGIQPMLDKQHLSVKGDFRYTLTMPDGTTQLLGPQRSDGSTRLNTVEPVQFVMKLDVSKANGVGPGTTGWFVVLDELKDGSGTLLHAGGVKGNYNVNLHGNANGDMIVTYTGCSGWDPAGTGTDSYGRPTPGSGAATGCKHYVVMLAAADGSEVWRHETPVLLDECRAVVSGDFFCVYQMSTGDAARDFGNSVTVVDYATHAASLPAGKDYTVLLKYNTAGIAQFSKVTHDQGLSYSQRNLGASHDGTVLAIAGRSKVSRIDPASGNLLWTDDNRGGGTGGHGYRGMVVTGSDDGTTDTSEMVVHGSLGEGSPTTLTDSTGSTITLRSRGSYSVFVAAFKGSDGTGKWAIDGGSGGIDYFFAFGSDPDTGDIYVGGGVYDTPAFFQWGDVKRDNPVRNYVPAPTNGYVGTTKGFTVKIKTTTTRPTCLDTCNSAIGPAPADVKTGHCFIDHHCYADGDFAPYPGEHCMKCDSTASSNSKMAWSGPDTSSTCFINGKCIDQGTHAQMVVGMSRGRPSYGPDPCNHCDVSSSSTAYTEINGCLLNMGTFAGGAFYINGSSLPASEQPAARAAAVVVFEQQAATDQAQIISLQDLLANNDCPNDDGGLNKTLAITMMAVLGALFLLVLIILCILIKRERQGSPIFHIVKTAPA